MNKELKEFLKKNEEYLELFNQFTYSMADVYELGGNLPLEIYPKEFQDFIEKWEKKAEELNQIKDLNKQASTLLKSLIEELQEKGNLYNHLNNIYRELKAYKQSNKTNSLTDDWDYFISNAIENLEESRTPLQKYYEHIKIDRKLIRQKKEIKFPLKDLEKLLNPLILKKTLSKELIRNLRQEFRSKRLKELSEIKEKKIKDKENFIKTFTAKMNEEDEFIQSLTDKEVSLAYFYHPLEIYGEKDIHLIQDLINDYLSQKLNIKEENIYPFIDKAIVKDGITNELQEEGIFVELTEETNEVVSKILKLFDGNRLIYIKFDRTEIFERILNKFQSEAEQKRKEQEFKEKNTEKFYKSYNKNKTQLPILHFISRNNPYLLTPEILRKNKEFKINSYWSSFILQATKDVEIFEPNDIKNLLAILSIKSAYIEHLKKEKLPDDDILKILVIDGFNIPLPMVAEIREISKRKENYQRIINSIDKAQKIQIKGKLSVDIKGEPLEVKKAFSFISEYEEITYKNKKALNIKLSPTVAKLLIEKKGRYYNRKLINNIPDNLLPLYFTLDNFRLNQNIKEKTISKKDLLENSRLAYSKTIEYKPYMVEKYLKDKLNKLKNGITIDKNTKIKLIKDWEEVEMYNGEEGIKIIFAD